MILCRLVCHGALTALAAGVFLVSATVAQQFGAPPSGPAAGGAYPGQSQPAPAGSYRLAERSIPAAIPPIDFSQHSPNEHPLMPALRWAYGGKVTIEQLQDYSATLVKRERINGTLGDYQYMFVKIRHNPFSVYLHFLAPNDLKGQEVIYIRGRNDGKLLAHGTGFQKMFGTVSLDPTGMIAMQGNRYPITEIGILNLVTKLIEIGEKDVQYGECEVKFFEAKIEDRPCTCIQVLHPIPRRNFLFNVARIYVDQQLNMPIRYEAYDWPAKPGGPPQLTEEYTYLNLKLNNGFTDADFDVRNPNYQFGGK